MASGPAKMADDYSATIRSLVDKVVEADITKQVSERVADVTGMAADRASETWRDTESTRHEAARNVARASRDAAKWSSRTWQRELRPTMRDLWKRRTVAIGAAGAAIPAGRELANDAAVRLGLRRREERHWGAFFLGLLIGAIAGAVIALLTAPKPGREVRDEIAAKARETEWAPIFQREHNGHADEVADELASPVRPTSEAVDVRREGEET